MTRWVTVLRMRLRTIVARSAVEDELDEELRYHIEREAERELKRGASLEQARYSALQAVRDIQQRKEECRDMRQWNFFENLISDFRYGLRSARKSPAFAVVSILTLALGIGAATAIFSVVEAVLLRALPYPSPDRIVRIWEQAPDGHTMSLANPNFEDLRAQNNTLTWLAAYSGAISTSVSGAGEPLRTGVAAVSKGFFDVLGVKPIRGRDFSAEEHRPHATPAAIVSHSYWQRNLAATSDLANVHLRLLGGVYPVIGVLPTGFHFEPGVDVWIASEVDPDDGDRTAHNWHAIGRLHRGVTIGEARANLGALARRIKTQYGKRADLNSAAVIPLADSTVGNVRAALWTLAGAVCLLLLIAWANVAGLLLARAAARRKELAVRIALGAGRLRLLQQFLAESGVLSLAGGILGTLFAIAAVRTLPVILPTTLPRQEEIAVNGAMLLFALFVTLMVGTFLGLFAAWRSASGDAADALGSASRTYAGSASGQRFRGWLVTGEIAATVLILTGAGLLGRSFVRLIETTPGFQETNLSTVEFSLPVTLNAQEAAARRASTVARLDELLDRLRRLPGARSVGLAGAMPVAAGDNLANGTFLVLQARKAPATFEEWSHMALQQDGNGYALYAVASEGYFRTLEIPLLRGRIFNDGDGPGAPHAAVISQTLARKRWPNGDALGQTIDFSNMDGMLNHPFTIVGIVGDVRASGLDAPPSPIVYVNYRQRGLNLNSSPALLIRNNMQAGSLAPAVREIFHQVAPDVPLKFSTFDEEMGAWLADRRFLLMLVGVFAAAALTLAAIGVYGVVAFSVTRRTQEIGIRMALGALRPDVLRLILGEGLRLAAAGVCIGILLSIFATRILASLLFGTSPTDPLTLVAVATLLAIVVLAASYIPARRAMRLDPNTALRYE